MTWPTASLSPTARARALAAGLPGAVLQEGVIDAPFADVYMEVHPERRRAGLGSYLVQAVIAACHADGRVAAARCSIENIASRATLTKAGMRVCGYMLSGTIVRPQPALGADA